MATARYNAHPFLVLLLVSYLVGLAAGLPAAEVIAAITEGFGRTIGYIGIVIAAGTIIGTLLERTGGAALMAQSVLRWIGEARSLLAMSITGAVVSIPVFCDSGFIILSPLNRSLAARSKESPATYAVALSMGLYATHVFVPPTPGPIAAAGELGADIGIVILLGLVVTVPVIAATYVFARAAGRRVVIDPPAAVSSDSRDPEEAHAAGRTDGEPQQLRSAWMAFTPVLLPVVLIAVQSIAALPGRPFGEGLTFAMLRFLGDPNTALLIGVAAAFVAVRRAGGSVESAWIADALRTGGLIILITGAGGAFGSVLQATPIGDYLGSSLSAVGLGLFSVFVPFVLAAALKTALGSSTVSIITSASILVPLLPALGMAGSVGPALATLAIGAGAMTVSHANDSYFWVVSQFSGMTVPQAYKLQTVGSAVAGVTGILAVLLLRLALL